MIRAALAAFVVLTTTGVAPKQSPATTPLSASLTAVREVRTVDLVPSEGFVFDSEKPGLTLTFSIAPPRGLTLLEVRQPMQVIANDSTGADLTNIESGFMGEQEYVAMKTSFDEAPTQFTMRLAEPSRKATTVTVAALFDAVFYADVQTDQIPITREWVNLPTALTDGEFIRVRLAGEGEQAELEMQPGSAKERFETITLLAGDGELENIGTWWSDDNATFMFQGSPDGVTQARFTARTGVRTKPIGVRVMKQMLP